MKKKFSIFLALEPYLLQWLIHESGQEPPIEIKPRSPEADILQLYLTLPPKEDYTPQFEPKEGELEILIPYFRHPDTRKYFYLPKKGMIALKECIKNRFRVQLWKDLHTIGVLIKRKDISISEWMEEHGIEETETNWNTIAKILQRKHAIYKVQPHRIRRRTMKEILKHKNL